MCDDEFVRVVLRGEGVVINGVWYNFVGDWQLLGQRSDGEVVGEEVVLILMIMMGIFIMLFFVVKLMFSSGGFFVCDNFVCGLLMVSVLVGLLLL